jgi:hypothetical protein
MLGLLLSERSIRAFSGFEWNRFHHSPGISRPSVNRWGSPPVILVVPTVVEGGVAVKLLTSGGAGFLKFGPTAQLARTSGARIARERPRSDLREVIL